MGLIVSDAKALFFADQMNIMARLVIALGGRIGHCALSMYLLLLSPHTCLLISRTNAYPTYFEYLFPDFGLSLILRRRSTRVVRKYSETDW